MPPTLRYRFQHMPNVSHVYQCYSQRVVFFATHIAAYNSMNLLAIKRGRKAPKLVCTRWLHVKTPLESISAMCEAPLAAAAVLSPESPP